MVKWGLDNLEIWESCGRIGVWIILVSISICWARRFCCIS